MASERAADLAATVAELRRLEAAATPGKWITFPSPTSDHEYRQGLGALSTDSPVLGYWVGAIDAGGGREREDAALIVALRNHASALLDALDAATAERDALYEALLLVAERAKRMYDGCDEEQMGEDMAEELLLLRHEVQDALALEPDAAAADLAPEPTPAENTAPDSDQTFDSGRKRAQPSNDARGPKTPEMGA